MNSMDQTDEFKSWLKGLTDARVQRAIADRVIQMAGGLMGDVKFLGDKVYEARIHHGPGYRLYYTRTGGTIYLLLCGGQKRSQKRDIGKAKELAARL